MLMPMVVSTANSAPNLISSSWCQSRGDSSRPHVARDEETRTNTNNIAPQATMETQNPREALTEVTAPAIAMMNAQTYSRAIALNMGAEYLGIGVCPI